MCSVKLLCTDQFTQKPKLMGKDGQFIYTSTHSYRKNQLIASSSMLSFAHHMLLG
jgi:hypothetical protein